MSKNAAIIILALTLLKLLAIIKEISCCISGHFGIFYLVFPHLSLTSVHIELHTFLKLLLNWHRSPFCI